MSVRVGESVDSLVIAAVGLSLHLQYSPQQNSAARWRSRIQQCRLNIGVLNDICARVYVNEIYKTFDRRVRQTPAQFYHNPVYSFGNCIRVPKLQNRIKISKDNLWTKGNFNWKPKLVWSMIFLF